MLLLDDLRRSVLVLDKDRLHPLVINLFLHEHNAARVLSLSRDGSVGLEVIICHQYIEAKLLSNFARLGGRGKASWL